MPEAARAAEPRTAPDGDREAGAGDLVAATERVHTLDQLGQLGQLLRRLRRRHARRLGARQLTVRELARRSGYAYGAISEYLSGRTLAPTDRLDVLVRLLGASPAEQRALATARDRVEDQRRVWRSAGRIPHELPPAGSGFTGRRTELAALARLLPRPRERPDQAAIAVITGTAGVGKPVSGNLTQTHN